MGKDIREVHYEAWRRNKNFVDIDVIKSTNEPGVWTGACRDIFDITVTRDSKQSAIRAMIFELSKVNYEVGNLSELYGLDKHSKG